MDVDTDMAWDAVVDVCQELAPVEVRRSRFADKPAIFLGGREVAHWEAPGRIDLRLTASGWRQHTAQFDADPAVVRDAGRRDWVDLQVETVDDVERLRPLLETALRVNAGGQRRR